MNRERYSFSRSASTIALAGALALSGCIINERETTSTTQAIAEFTTPDSVPEKLEYFPRLDLLKDELEGRSEVYNYAYALGILVGCNPNIFLDENNEIALTDKTMIRVKEVFSQDPEEAQLGLEAGLSRGLKEYSDPKSAICFEQPVYY